MAFDTKTRNRLNQFVGDARALLTEKFTEQCQVEFGMNPETGEVTELERLSHLDDAQRQTAIILRETLNHYYANLPTKQKDQAKDYQSLIQRIVREQAFTILNRLCAIRMAEARDLVIESIGAGVQSKGFQLYQHVCGNSLGETGAAYQQYLLSLFDEFGVDLPVLFDRYSPQGRLFPRETVLTELIGMINDPEINRLWAEDETIGWIYQYFNSKEERKAMRDASQAPRNSRELAVRNQFFTPRYVVEFLTDNTLGRIWYEMRKGETGLKESCQYLVRRPNEIFLSEGEEAPETESEDQEKDLTQEELLNQPVHIPHRPLKDPREIRMLDPACGSMHFGLYAFDLYLKIYEEFWDLVKADPAVAIESTELPSLTQIYESRESFVRDVPRLIIEHNIHGIDIDPRAVQIAGLSLWLRAQRAWKSQDIAAGDRPQVTRSNIVCAEPMPGDQDQLDAFCQTLHPAIAQMVTAIFEEMKLAGEAGSLLKIEEEISSLVARAKEQWQQQPKEVQQELFGGPSKPVEQQREFDLSGITDQQFFEQAEETIYEALRKYASETSEGGFRRKLFAGDAEKGFAFLSLLKTVFDVALMNPPFGSGSEIAKKHLESKFPQTKNDVLSAFVKRSASLLVTRGLLGALTSRTALFLSSFEEWRKDVLLKQTNPIAIADFGPKVLDAAMVEVAAYCLQANPDNSRVAIFRLVNETVEEKPVQLRQCITDFLGTVANKRNYDMRSHVFGRLPTAPFAYWAPKSLLAAYEKFPEYEKESRNVLNGASTCDDFRYVRTWWETDVDAQDCNWHWAGFAKGGEFSRFYYDVPVVVPWDEKRFSFLGFIGRPGRWNPKPVSADHYFQPAITWPLRGSRFSAQALPSGCAFSVGGKVALAECHELSFLLGVLNSSVFNSAISFFAGNITGFQFESGVIGKAPIPVGTADSRQQVGNLAVEGWRLQRSLDSVALTSHAFGLPELLQVSNGSLESRVQGWLAKKAKVNSELSKIQKTLDKTCFELYQVKATEIDFGEPVESNGPSTNTDIRELELVLIQNAVSWSVGVAFGLFDIRRAMTNDVADESFGPFDEIVHKSPGMLPRKSLSPPNGYPIDFPSYGILVDSQSDPRDIVAAIRLVWDQVFEESDNIWQEAVQGLASQNRDFRYWLRANFFQDHLGEFTKSRREAPIYWPISTESGSYTLWFYYHRLTDQTLYLAVNDFVDPKLKQTNRQLADLRAIKDRSSTQEKELAQLTELESELEQFKADLLEIAAFWKPNLNDGVQITAAPLWKFFRLTKWRNKLKKTWSELESGKYDWAHLALSIWPERVVKEKCTNDRSIAIAHDLEEQLWHEVEVTKVSKSGRERTKIEWQPRQLTESQLDEIIEKVKSN